jgi:negative regulator of sigma E activity
MLAINKNTMNAIISVDNRELTNKDLLFINKGVNYLKNYNVNISIGLRYTYPGLMYLNENELRKTYDYNIVYLPDRIARSGCAIVIRSDTKERTRYAEIRNLTVIPM